MRLGTVDVLLNTGGIQPASERMTDRFGSDSQFLEDVDIAAGAAYLQRIRETGRR